ncbi:unnamed protein product [Brassica napus]|uniref:(rape) hypothetical protein n=2 Tax=Brassica TaxID=3705 RepID=A0A816IZS1_BRANA|nr:unnamed protein product [Brassica napus]
MGKKWNLMMIFLVVMVVAREGEAEGSPCESHCVIHCGGHAWPFSKFCQNLCLVKQCNYPPVTSKVKLSLYVLAHILLIVSLCLSRYISMCIAELTRFLIFKYKLFGDLER